MGDSSIIEFKSQPPSRKSEQSKSQLPISSKMLQALNIETNIVESYEKLQKQLKKQNFVNYNDYKVIIGKFEVRFCSIKGFLLKKLSKLENLIHMGNNVLNVVPGKNCDSNKFNDVTFKLK